MVVSSVLVVMAGVSSALDGNVDSVWSCRKAACRRGYSDQTHAQHEITSKGKQHLELRLQRTIEWFGAKTEMPNVCIQCG